jgi:hypothetical protein
LILLYIKFERMSRGRFRGHQPGYTTGIFC